jgi:hypothetical protein
MKNILTGKRCGSTNNGIIIARSASKSCYGWRRIT